MIDLKNKSIILFDGVCNLCNDSVQFIIKKDKKNNFSFTSLQSDVAKDILLHYKKEKSDLDSIILIEKEKLYDKSTAVLKISKQLSGIWKFAYLFIIVPKFIRDFFYMLISKKRYQLFGKRDECMVPTEALRNKFLS